MNTEETDYFERYLTYRKKHTSLLNKQERMIAKYEKEISQIKENTFKLKVPENYKKYQL